MCRTIDEFLANGGQIINIPGVQYKNTPQHKQPERINHAQKYRRSIRRRFVAELRRDPLILDEVVEVGKIYPCILKAVERDYWCVRTKHDYYVRIEKALDQIKCEVRS